MTIFFDENVVEPLCHGSRSVPTQNPDIYIFNQF